MWLNSVTKVETRLPSACILAIPLLCGRASHLSNCVYLRIAWCGPVRSKESSFARLALCQGLCALQMCLLLRGLMNYCIYSFL